MENRELQFKLNEAVNKINNSFRLIQSRRAEIMANISELIIKGNKIELELLNNIGNEGIKRGWAFTQKISYELQYSIIINEIEGKSNSDNYKILLESVYKGVMDELADILDGQGSHYLKNQWELVENNMLIQFVPYQMILIEKLMRETINPSEKDKYISNAKLRNKMKEKVNIIEKHIAKNIPYENMSNFDLSMNLLSKTYNTLIMNDLYLSADSQKNSKIAIINRQNVLHYYINLDEIEERDFHQLMFVIICMIDLYYLLHEIEFDY